PDISPPASIMALQNSTYAQTHINWSWTDPEDADFFMTIIYLDGIFQTNAAKGSRFYNASGLASNTSYAISTHTADLAGNVNQTWVNHTAKTASTPAIYDLNKDETVDVLDLVMAAQRFGETTSDPHPNYDVNADGIVDIADIVLVAQNFT
ncbi:MAG: dockerin type I domain-containing protein, partial [Candidatus Omnitrophota bacterium]